MCSISQQPDLDRFDNYQYCWCYWPVEFTQKAGQKIRRNKVYSITIIIIWSTEISIGTTNNSNLLTAAPDMSGQLRKTQTLKSCQLEYLDSGLCG